MKDAGEHQGNGTESTMPTGQHSGTFHTGYNELLLFQNLIISTQLHLAAACVVIFLIAILNEGVRVFVSWLKTYTNTVAVLSGSRYSVTLLGVAMTFLHVSTVFMGYCLMIIFMLLNVWICLAMLFGAGAGFLLFQFEPVKSRISRLLPRRQREGGVGNLSEEKSVGDQASARGYEQISEFRMQDCDRKSCAASQKNGHVGPLESGET